MAHVRRKLDDAEKAHPNRKATKGSAANCALGLIGKLYADKKRIRDCPSKFGIASARMSPSRCLRRPTRG